MGHLNRSKGSGITPVVSGEMTTVESTVSFDVLDTYSSVLAAMFSVRLTVNTLGDNGVFTLTVDGHQFTSAFSFVTMFIYSGTTLKSSFISIQIAFYFTGEGTSFFVNAHT